MPSKVLSRAFEFASSSNPGVTYQTLEYTDGSTSCECRGWIYKKKTSPDGARSCKHTRWVEMGTAEQHARAVKDYNKQQSKVEAIRNTSNAARPMLVEQASRVFDLEDTEQ